MGQFKDQGSAVMALAEECAEVIQHLAKLERFQGGWEEIPPGKTKSRWDMVVEEMEDLLYQWKRVQDEREESIQWAERAYKLEMAQRALENPEDYGLV
jgi:NTP pyrophosphatase (non-canonical NTP hydrolase)